jgi:Zn/Cd-binding protein ZinT
MVVPDNGISVCAHHQTNRLEYSQRAENINNLGGGKDRKGDTMKKRHDVFFGFAVMMIAAIFTSAGCGNGESELAKWNGTWNGVYDYLDDPGLDASFQAQYDALIPDYQEYYGSVQGLRDFAKAVALTDFGSFVVQGNTITFYDQKANAENPSGDVIETVTYTFKGTLHDVFARTEEFDWYAFEGDAAGPHKYLLFEEVGRDTPSGPLHFHMRYGSKSFEDLLIDPVNNYGQWYPTIVSYNTTIAELQEFMSGD